MARDTNLLQTALHRATLESHNPTAQQQQTTTLKKSNLPDFSILSLDPEKEKRGKEEAFVSGNDEDHEGDDDRREGSESPPEQQQQPGDANYFEFSFTQTINSSDEEGEEEEAEMDDRLIALKSLPPTVPGTPTFGISRSNSRSTSPSRSTGMMGMTRLNTSTNQRKGSVSPPSSSSTTTSPTKLSHNSKPLPSSTATPSTPTRLSLDDRRALRRAAREQERKRTALDPMRRFGEEIKVGIFGRLDVESLKKCRCVCGRWKRSVTLNWCFFRLHQSLLFTSSSSTTSTTSLLPHSHLTPLTIPGSSLSTTTSSSSSTSASSAAVAAAAWTRKESKIDWFQRYKSKRLEVLAEENPFGYSYSLIGGGVYSVSMGGGGGGSSNGGSLPSTPGGGKVLGGAGGYFADRDIIPSGVGATPREARELERERRREREEERLEREAELESSSGSGAVSPNGPGSRYTSGATTPSRDRLLTNGKGKSGRTLAPEDKQAMREFYKSLGSNSKAKSKGGRRGIGRDRTGWDDERGGFVGEIEDV